MQHFVTFNVPTYLNKSPRTVKLTSSYVMLKYTVRSDYTSSHVRDYFNTLLFTNRNSVRIRSYIRLNYVRKLIFFINGNVFAVIFNSMCTNCTPASKA